MPIWSFLNQAGEVMTVIGPCDNKPPVDGIAGAVEVIEGDATEKGAKRAPAPAAPVQSETIESLKARLDAEVVSVKARLAVVEGKVAAEVKP